LGLGATERQAVLLYKQKTGQLFRGDSLLAVGYSGAGEGKNSPLAQHVPNVGPIPAGAYNIGSLSDSAAHGPVAIHLLPVAGTEMFGRSAFLIHGDSVSAPGTASQGCIIMSRPVRDSIIGRDTLLVVISGNV